MKRIIALVLSIICLCGFTAWAEEPQDPPEVAVPESDAEDAAPLDVCAVQVSDATRAFLARVASVVFSDPSLVWVGRIEETSSVGSAAISQRSAVAPAGGSGRSPDSAKALRPVMIMMPMRFLKVVIA